MQWVKRQIARVPQSTAVNPEALVALLQGELREEIVEPLGVNFEARIQQVMENALQVLAEEATTFTREGAVTRMA